MARQLAGGTEHRGPASKSSKTKKAESQSRKRWIEALAFLLQHADQRFGDVAWATNPEGTEDVIWAHKALLYARSSAGVLHRYLQGYRSPVPAAGSSTTSLAQLPSSWSDDRLSPSIRSVSPDPSLMSVATIRRPMQLEVTDRALLDPLLQYIYTGQGQVDAFAFLYEEAQLQQSLLQDPLIRLSQDLLFMWRSKLYADVLIHLVPANATGATDQTHDPQESQVEVFASHRAILATVPYFESMLLGSYSDRDNRILTLPSPPLTPASLHFVLGYLYCGSLDFSQRTFDLNTAFSIYTSAQYLGMDTLRLEVECRIEDMCFGPNPDPLRCARLFQWSLLPDVSCPMLQQRSKGVVLDRFAEAWRIEVGSLDQDVQQLLVTEKCLSITPDSAIDALRGVMTIRSKLETINQPWASHVLAMLEPVEARVSKLMVTDTTSVVTSPGFVELIEGRTFSSDLLEKALQTLSQNLEERTAALAYQAVVGHVLLREQGIQVDARVLVEDCRQAILKYLKSRWVGTKAASGFNDLDSWSLKEIADELDMKPQDLIAVDEPPPTPVTRTGPRPMRKSAASNDSDVSLRASLLNRNAASTMIKSQHRIHPSPPTAAARATQAPRLRPLRPAHGSSASPSTEAISSSVRTRSTATSDASTRKPRTSHSSAVSDTTAETSAEDLQPSASTSSIDTADNSVRSKVSRTSAVASGRRSAEPPSSTSTRTAVSANRRPAPLSARVRTVSHDGASARASVRSTAASLARERATAAAREKAAAPPPPLPTRPPRAPSAASVRSLGTSPSARPTARSTASSARSGVTARSVRNEKSVVSTSTKPTQRTPTSTSRSPSVANSATASRSTSSHSLAASGRTMSTKSISSIASKRTNTTTTPVRDRKTSVKSTSSSNLSVQHGRVAKRPAFGTSLNVGIRCVVSFTNGQKSTGSVLYLGPVPEMSAGNWVGVEIDEPDDVTADNVEWTDGILDGVRYFTQSRKRRDMQCGVFVRPAQVMYLF